MNIWEEYARRYIPDQTYPQLWTRTGELPWLPETEVCARRLKQALDKKESVCIYSDYDTDAVTATAVMYKGLIMLGFDEDQLSYYAPDRFTEGYGMNPEALTKLSQEYDLIISVDCGINSVKEADIVKDSNADLIITDHHHLHSDVPSALAVINPRLNEHYLQNLNIYESRGGDKQYIIQNQNDFMSFSVTGVGVAWFTLLWTAHHWNKNGADIDMKQFEWLLPIVAIGTIADCQSIIDNQNRLLVKIGISIFNNHTKQVPGLQTLLETTGLNEKISNGYQINSQDFAFTFSPILNSSGRLTHAKLSIDVLIKGDITQAQQLTQINEERKQMVKDIVSDLDSQAREQFESGQKAIWLEGPWSKGLVGLLASRIESAYDIPTAVLSVMPDEDTISASLRAPEGYHWPKILDRVSPGLLKAYGGHPQAAGFKTDAITIEKLKSEILSLIGEREKISEEVWSHEDIPEDLLYLKAEKDVVILKRLPTEDELSKVWEMDPFGQDFPFPQILFPIGPGSIRWLSGQKHIKLAVDGINLLWFNLTTENREVIHGWEGGQQMWVLGKPTQSAWRGTLRSELIIEEGWLL